jgi:hypothetical protein
MVDGLFRFDWFSVMVAADAGLTDLRRRWSAGNVGLSRVPTGSGPLDQFGEFIE